MVKYTRGLELPAILSIYWKPAGNLLETSAASFPRFPDYLSLTDHTVCSTLKFENLSNNLFWGKKNEKKLKKITTLFSKNWKKILPLKTWENCPQKLLIIGPIYFVSTDLATQTAQKQKHRTTKSPLMQDWVFRLGCWTTPGPWLN